MLEARIINMVCGHCRLKIEAELQEAGFEQISFDMLLSTVKVEEGNLKNEDLFHAIHQAGYLVDRDYHTPPPFLHLYLDHEPDANDKAQIHLLLKTKGVTSVSWETIPPKVILQRNEIEEDEAVDIIETFGYAILLQE